jgi:carboxypeptidase C (cathepsin A)
VPGTNGTKITERATRWNRYSNMLYLESPAGVGFSYQDDVGPNGTYATDDLRTARLNLNFLLQFFKAFPKYAGREFYITGESYAGTYIPTLAWAIAQYNANQPSSPINFKGFAVGNPCSAELIDHNAFFEAVKVKEEVCSVVFLEY